MSPSAQDDEIRRRLDLTGVSYADWEKEAAALRNAADSAEIGRYVDGRHLTRAGEIAAEIDEEIVGLDEMALSASGEALGQIMGVRDRLAALVKDIRESARLMHGML